LVARALRLFNSAAILRQAITVAAGEHFGERADVGCGGVEVRAGG
jgi:hypothetical protein